MLVVRPIVAEIQKQWTGTHCQSWINHVLLLPHWECRWWVFRCTPIPGATSNVPSMDDFQCALDEQLHCTLDRQLCCALDRQLWCDLCSWHPAPSTDNFDVPLMDYTTAPSMGDFLILHHSVPLSRHPGPPNLPTHHSPATLQLNGVLHAQLWPTWHRFLLAQLDDHVSIAGEYGFWKVVMAHQDVEDFGWFTRSHLGCVCDEISARAIIWATYCVCWGPLQTHKDTIMRHWPLIYPRNSHVILDYMASK